jgi:hypothetical protein
VAPAFAGKRTFFDEARHGLPLSGGGSLSGAKPLRSRIVQMAAFTWCSAAYSVRWWVDRNTHLHHRSKGDLVHD